MLSATEGQEEISKLNLFLNAKSYLFCRRRHSSRLDHDDGAIDLLLLHSIHKGLDGFHGDLVVFGEEHDHLVRGVLLVRDEHEQLAAAGVALARLVAVNLLEFFQRCVQLLRRHEVAAVPAHLFRDKASKIRIQRIQKFVLNLHQLHCTTVTSLKLNSFLRTLSITVKHTVQGIVQSKAKMKYGLKMFYCKKFKP